MARACHSRSVQACPCFWLAETAPLAQEHGARSTSNFWFNEMQPIQPQSTKPSLSCLSCCVCFKSACGRQTHASAPSRCNTEQVNISPTFLVLSSTACIYAHLSCRILARPSTPAKEQMDHSIYSALPYQCRACNNTSQVQPPRRPFIEPDRHHGTGRIRGGRPPNIRSPHTPYKTEAYYYYSPSPIGINLLVAL